MAYRFASTTNPQDVADLANKLKRERLHSQFTHWESGMEYFYKRPNRIQVICAAYFAGTIVGSAILWDRVEYGTNMGIFVRKAHRRKGVGTGLMKKLSLMTQFHILPAINESPLFFQSLGYREMTRLELTEQEI